MKKVMMKEFWIHGENGRCGRWCAGCDHHHPQSFECHHFDENTIAEIRENIKGWEKLMEHVNQLPDDGKLCQF